MCARSLQRPRHAPNLKGRAQSTDPPKDRRFVRKQGSGSSSSNGWCPHQADGYPETKWGNDLVPLRPYGQGALNTTCFSETHARARRFCMHARVCTSICTKREAQRQRQQRRQLRLYKFIAMRSHLHKCSTRIYTTNARRCTPMCTSAMRDINLGNTSSAQCAAICTNAGTSMYKGIIDRNLRCTSHTPRVGDQARR